MKSLRFFRLCPRRKPEPMLKRIDRHAAEHGLTRSAFLVRAAMKNIDAETSEAVPAFDAYAQSLSGKFIADCIVFSA